MGDFVHLHLHTEYSLLDGCVRLTTGAKHDIHPLAEALKARNMKAVAITDHGNMYGVYAFVDSLKGTGIKPIIGEEFYTCDDMYQKSADIRYQRWHLILLAKNDEGYHNLVKLSSASFIDGFYDKPRIDMDILAKHSKGLICLSACIAGKIPQLILDNKFQEAKDYAIKLRDMFEPGDFYIELQDHGIDEERKVRNDLIRIAKEIGVKVVATNDVHYIEKEDADVQDDMMCIQLGIRKDEQNPIRFTEQEFYLKTAEEMEELFGWCPEALASTVEIADKCTFEFQLKAKENLIPPYSSEEMGDRTPEQYLKDLCWEGLVRRYDVITPEIKKRAKEELEVIISMGYATYFLIVWDYINAAKKMGIPVGPGRGSGVGSIVAYAIGITDVEPLRFNLLFQRFLAKERVSMPDFDVDFCYVRRGEVIDYVTKKYGRDRVSQIIAYGTMKAKQAVKDIARIYNISYEKSNNWAKTISKDPGATLKGCLDEKNDCFSPEFKKLYDTDPEAKRIVDKAMKIEGLPRQTGMHAAGVVICSQPVTDYVPLSRNKEFIVTQFDKTQVEPLGMLKMDFLGLKTLTDIKEAQKYILEDKGVDVNFEKDIYDDPKVYELIASGDCVAVFQLESGGMCDFMAKLKPTTLEDVIAGISIYRPGPMQFMNQFIAGKKNPENVTYLHPKLKPILEVTYGCMVYQEQIMQIARELAGYSYGGADILRRAISKKKPEVIARNKTVFANGGYVEGDSSHTPVIGAIANGVPAEVVDTLFEQLAKFAEYCFNKSHATAYAVLTYQTAYLKCYYPIHFLTAIINNRIGDAKEQSHYINYMRKIGINILKPDINKSKKNFSIDGNDVRFGLMGIKNVGESAIEAVLAERVNGPYKDIRDFFKRCGKHLNSRMVESMIYGGAFDCFGKNRATLMASYKSIWDLAAKEIESSEQGQFSIFDNFGIEEQPVSYIEIKEFKKEQLLAEEKNNLGMYVSGHPLDDYNTSIFKFDLSRLEIEKNVETNAEGEETHEDLSDVEENAPGIEADISWDKKQVRFGCIVSSWEKKKNKNNQVFAVGELEDKGGTIQFTIFYKLYEQLLPVLMAERPIIVVGKIDLSGSEPKLIVDDMTLWNKGGVEPDPQSEEPQKVLYALIEGKEELDLIRAIAASYPGDDILKIQMGTTPETKRIMAFKKGIRVCDEIVEQIANVVGKNNVKVKVL